jgi:trigger factor
MQSEVSELSPTLVEVKVEVPWERVRKDLDEHFGRIAKTAKIKGFRPGKVPRNVVRNLYGKQVKGEVAAHLVEQGLLEAVQQHELQVVAQPEVDTPQVEEGKPLEFKARCEIRPHIESVELEGLELYRSPTEPSDEQIDPELERLREQHAEVQVPEPMRPSQEGDQLTIDYTVTVDGDTRDDLGASDRSVELGGGRLLEEFEQGLTGTQPGDTVDIEVTFPDDHGREDLQGKTATFQVTVKELQEKNLPELDDEFAKDVGDYETLDELREKIRQDKRQEAEQKQDSELKEQAVDKLIELNDVPVPPSMVQQQQQQMMQEFAQFMQMTGQQMPMSEEMQQSMQQRAERRVRAGILLGALARQEGVEVTEEDIEAKFQEMAEQSGKHIAKVRAEHQGEERQNLESQLLENKLMDILLERAHIKEGPPPESAEAQQEGQDQAAAEHEEQT